MNDSYLSDEDYSSVQSEADIKRILSEAQTPGPNKYNFDNQVGFVWCCVPCFVSFKDLRSVLKRHG
jgi:hypothetical protein